MDNIKRQFPELANIDPLTWNEVCRETHLYQNSAAYILLDLQESYRTCWRIQMTKRCAQMLLKYESTAATQLYETGILGQTEYSHIVELIENKLFDLDFYRVQMPKGQTKAVENAFDLLTIFRPLPNREKIMWKTILKSKVKWIQPGRILLEKGEVVSEAYLIARGVIQCQADESPVYYRSGSIVPIDGLFSAQFTAHGRYSTTASLLQAFIIDTALLKRLLDDDNLAPSVYREIALHLLINHYSTHFKLNRSQLKLLLRIRARFYRKQADLSIQVKANGKLLLLAGSVLVSSETQNDRHHSVTLKVFNDSTTTVVLNMGTVAYLWTDDDEIACLHTKHIQPHFPVQTFGSISHELLYPGYSQEIEQFLQRRYSTGFLHSPQNSKNDDALEQKF